VVGSSLAASLFTQAVYLRSFEPARYLH